MRILRQILEIQINGLDIVDKKPGSHLILMKNIMRGLCGR